jgi:hypothetical protein
MKLFSASEVEVLLNELADEAAAAIEEAAGEAAKAATLAAIGEQAAAVAAANLEFSKLKHEYATTKRATMKKVIIVGAVSFLAGAVVGVICK